MAWPRWLQRWMYWFRERSHATLPATPSWPSEENIPNLVAPAVALRDRGDLAGFSSASLTESPQAPDETTSLQQIQETCERIARIVEALPAHGSASRSISEGIAQSLGEMARALAHVSEASRSQLQILSSVGTGLEEQSSTIGELRDGLLEVRRMVEENQSALLPLKSALQNQADLQKSLAAGVERVAYDLVALRDGVTSLRNRIEESASQVTAVEARIDVLHNCFVDLSTETKTVNRSLGDLMGQVTEQGARLGSFGEMVERRTHLLFWMALASGVLLVITAVLTAVR